jgi:hypothetical protein
LKVYHYAVITHSALYGVPGQSQPCPVGLVVSALAQILRLAGFGSVLPACYAVVFGSKMGSLFRCLLCQLRSLVFFSWQILLTLLYIV